MLSKLACLRLAILNKALKDRSFRFLYTSMLLLAKDNISSEECSWNDWIYEKLV